MEEVSKNEEKIAMNSAFAYGSFTASDGTVIPYRYYLPEDYATSGKNYPVFFYLHGNGSRGTDNKAHLSAYSINTAVFNSDHECIIIAPQCPGRPEEWTLYGSVGKVNTYPGSKAYAEFLESGEPYGSKYFCAAAELLDMFLTDYRAETSRVYLAGGSNGAGAVWNLMALYPEVFAAAVPIAGSRATEEAVHSVAHRMKDIAIWTFHGDQDNEAGVPPEGTRIMSAAIKDIGGNITYTEVVGGNHSNIWRIAADTEGLIDWLFAQRNGSFENTISKEKGEALPAPTNLSWNGNTATWDAVENAGAYKITLYISGIAAKTYYTYKNSFTPDIPLHDGVQYNFIVRAFPQKNQYSISAESVMSGVYVS